MSDKSGFGDRMKEYERQETGRRLLPLLPAIARIDGKNFSRFTRGLERPYDKRLSDLMVATCKHLVEESNALCGYTQSDEISLLFYSEDTKSQIFFDGKIQKMNSVLASMTAAYFNYHKSGALPSKKDHLANFDSRVWSVPNQVEAANVFLWRERDATKNSVSMAAREHYSHKELLGKSGNEMQELLFQKGVNWNDYPAFFKRGTFVQRKTVRRAFSAEELATLPPKHAAHDNPDLEIERSTVGPVEMPPFDSVTNRVEVLFTGAAPLTDKQTR
jgi:tRNA(His) 5'-end guanylyltransferase